MNDTERDELAHYHAAIVEGDDEADETFVVVASLTTRWEIVDGQFMRVENEPDAT